MILNDFIKKSFAPKNCVIEFAYQGRTEAEVTADAGYRITRNDKDAGNTRYVSVELPAFAERYKILESKYSGYDSPAVTTTTISVASAGDTVTFSFKFLNSGTVIIEAL